MRVQCGALIQRFFAISSLIFACSDAPQVRVFFCADEALGSEGTTLTVEIYGGDELVLEEQVSLPAEHPFLHETPAGVTLSPEGGDTGRRWRVVATLMNADGDVIGQQQAIGGYADGIRRINLCFTRDCESVSCAAGLVCDEGQCQEPCVALGPADSDARAARVECRCEDLVDGSLCQDGAGRCWQGNCCTGCFDSEHCVEGNRPDACGRGGAECSACCPGGTCSDSGSCQNPVELNWVQTSESSIFGDQDHSVDGHTCAASTNRLFCWGANASSQLGDGTQMQSCDAVAHALEGAFAVGEDQTCNLSWERDLSCWGNSGDGLLAFWDEDQTTPPAGQPVGFEYDGRGITLNSSSGCGIRQGELWCWGSDCNFSAGGINGGLCGSTPASLTRIVEDRSDFFEVSMNRWTGCAIASRTQGNLYCWGFNEDGATGVSRAEAMFVMSAQQVQTQWQWRSVSVGWFGSCGITMDDVLYCWGRHVESLLGLTEPPLDITNLHVPRRVPGRWQSVTVSKSHMCAIDLDDQIHCAGKHDVGQLGIGDSPTTEVNRLVPVGPVGFRWASVSVGHGTTCAVRDDQSVWCWGANDTCQLGIDGINSSASPQQLCLESSR